MNKTRRCKNGEFYRKSYTRTMKNGSPIRVKGVCVRSQRMTKPLLCPTGYILRNSYVRVSKRGVRSHIPEHCILDRGLPGKGFRGTKSGIGPLRKGELAKYGYHNVILLTLDERRSALRKAVRAYGSLGVWRKLNAVFVYTKYTSPPSSQIFKQDMDWIRSEFGV